MLDTKAYQKMNYGLSLLGAAAGGKRQGCIINSFHQVTSSYPPKFTVTLNKNSETCKAVLTAGSFAVTLLGQGCPKELIDCFGYKSGRAGDKFAAYDTQSDAQGNPYLTEGMVARFGCQVVERLEIGNYILLVAQVTEAQVLSAGVNLTLNEFTAMGKTVPASATAYRALEEVEGWKCSVCGYVHYGSEPPTDYICPLCRATRDKFGKIS